MSAQPRTGFEWSMYADATLAGLSVLVPVPFMDDASESFFRKRMLRSIARSRGVELSDEVRATLGQGEGWRWSRLPITLTVGLIKRLSRKVLYFLTIKKSSEQLSHYWHRAFLLDYMIASGHLDDAASATAARQAMDRVLDSTATPLNRLAGEVIRHSKNVARTVQRARQDQADEDLEQTRGEMASRWDEFREYLEGVAARYDEEYRRATA